MNPLASRKRRALRIEMAAMRAFTTSVVLSREAQRARFSSRNISES